MCDSRNNATWFIVTKIRYTWQIPLGPKKSPKSVQEQFFDTPNSRREKVSKILYSIAQKKSASPLLHEIASFGGPGFGRILFKIVIPGFLNALIYIYTERERERGSLCFNPFCNLDAHLAQTKTKGCFLKPRRITLESPGFPRFVEHIFTFAYLLIVNPAYGSVRAFLGPTFLMGPPWAHLAYGTALGPPSSWDHLVYGSVISNSLTRG